MSADHMWTHRQVRGSRYERLAVRTRWLTAADRLEPALREFLPPTRAGDTVVISEKAAVFLSGLAVPIEQLRPGRVARFLARLIRPRAGSRGLSVPEKMQYLVEHLGLGRLLAAAVSAALTRPFGIAGMFYRVAGSTARDIDGARPPYEHLVLPPFTPAQAVALCEWLERELGVGVAIVDVNDFGGTIRGCSPLALPADVLLEVLADNPLGQRLAGTPFGVVRGEPAGLAGPSRAAATPSWHEKTPGVA